MQRILQKKKIIAFVAFILIIFGLTVCINFVHNSSNSTYSGVGGLDIDNGDTKINWTKYTSTTLSISDSLNITSSGIYYLSGDIENGFITIDVGDDNGVVKLVLDDLNINCDDGPAIYVKSADDVIIETTKDSENSLVSGSSFRSFEEDDGVNATIYSKSDLSFYGDGILYVESNYQDAIVSKDDLVIRSGEIQIKSIDDGIRGKDSVYISGGKVIISAKQDGIKSTNEDNERKGFVYISDGDIELDVSDDGIHATTSLIIDDGRVNILNSYEGLEGGKITINGGDIDIVSNDDGVNVAGGNDESAFMRPGSQNFSSNIERILSINGGDIYVNAAGDGLDSNGLIYLNGGTISVDGPKNSGNGALDSENGIYFNGGSVIAIGSSGMAEAFTDGSLGFGVSIYYDSTLSAGTKISIKDSNGNEIISHTSIKPFNHAAIGSEMFEIGKTYRIFIDDEQYQEFTISDYLTTVGENTSMDSNNMQAQPNMRMPSNMNNETPPSGGDGGAPAMPNNQDDNMRKLDENQGDSRDDKDGN